MEREKKLISWHLKHLEKTGTEEKTLALSKNREAWEALPVYLHSDKESMMCKNDWIPGASCLLKNLNKAVWTLMEQQINMAENYYLVKKISKFNLTIKKKIESSFYTLFQK